MSAALPHALPSSIVTSAPKLLAPVPAAVERPVALRLDGVSKRHGVGADAVIALDTMSLSVRAGEFVCIVGASGCGKSTMLNLVAGLDTPSAGQVHVEGGRPALMFQESALFPWLTVEENVAFPLQMQGVGRGERKQRVAELLAMVHLEKFARRRPHELSGGMKQRVALARALAQRASLLLMDEPFAALDAMMRDHLHLELEQLWQQTGLTVVFVTHNVREAVRLGDRVLLLSSRPGRLVAEYDIDIPRPRRIESTEVAGKAREITDRLHEAARHA
ncbi:MAG TPA: ABC transporter ATP-binding protein [Rhodoglobus sp.]|nr:ABC transporter ATP-binding protein [Rhodoglobus sp.]